VTAFCNGQFVDFSVREIRALRANTVRPYEKERQLCVGAVCDRPGRGVWKSKWRANIVRPNEKERQLCVGAVCDRPGRGVWNSKWRANTVRPYEKERQLCVGAVCDRPGRGVWKSGAVAIPGKERQ